MTQPPPGETMKPFACAALILSVPAAARLPQTPFEAHPQETREREPSTRHALDAVLNWPEATQRVARAMITRYGSPDRWDDRSMAWIRRGSWEKIVVRREGPRPLEQTIGYRVPPAKLGDLPRFDERVAPNPDTNELTASAVDERENFLLLNLADDLVTEKRGVEDAKAFRDRVLRLSAAGKSSPYLAGFLFEPPNEKVVTP
jgi:hypothetical protein